MMCRYADRCSMCMQDVRLRREVREEEEDQENMQCGVDEMMYKCICMYV